MDVTLTIHSVEGAMEVPLSGSRLTLGRTNESDIVINDKSLSRVHASINREGDRIWITDEGSTNGTSVNGQPVPGAGAPLHDGDEIYLGETTIVVRVQHAAAATAIPDEHATGAAPITGGLAKPVIASAAALVILLTLIVIGVAYRNSGRSGQITLKKNDAPNDNQSSDTATDGQSSPDSSSASSPGPTPDETGNLSSPQPLSPAKRYLAMSPDEQRQFVASESQHVARMIGNREGYAFTPEVVNKIKIWVDAYAHRLNSPKPAGGCNMHHDLTTLLNRARTYAPAVVKAFNEKGLSPQVGIYLAMIEAEYCPCLSSGTGPKGYFQFASSTARRYGVQDVSSPKDTRPDDRCKIDIMAPIAAQYMKDLIAMFGTGPLSVPLAVASYNEGEGGLSGNLLKALNAARTSDNPERSFWTMVAHEEILSDQFQRENIKYVPHFFGAAIVGENPRVFGVDLLPISSYAQQGFVSKIDNTTRGSEWSLQFQPTRTRCNFDINTTNGSWWWIQVRPSRSEPPAVAGGPSFGNPVLPTTSGPPAAAGGSDLRWEDVPPGGQFEAGLELSTSSRWWFSPEGESAIFFFRLDLKHPRTAGRGVCES